MNGVAYSYLRFSTPEQAMGDSRRRQLSLAEAYARQNGLLLDLGLNFRDLGISAFRGKNAKEGGCGRSSTPSSMVWCRRTATCSSRASTD